MISLLIKCITACIITGISILMVYDPVIGFFKKKKAKLLTENDLVKTKYKVGKLVATITDFDDNTYISSFVGKIDIIYTNNYNSIYLDKNFKNFNNIEKTLGRARFNNYLINVYGKTNMFEMDNDILILSHRIKNITYVYDENFEIDFFYYKN